MERHDSDHRFDYLHRFPGGDLLINGDPFFINIFFTGGDPNGASFSGDWVTPVPEPSGLVLFGSGILALAGIVSPEAIALTLLVGSE